MSDNGRLKQSELTLIQTDLYLAVKTARAWKRLVAAAKKKLGRTYTAAQKAGAYRSFAVQGSMQRAFDSHDQQRKLDWNMDLNSTVRPADPGRSTHGWGTTVDVVGGPLDHDFKALAKTHGFTFPYPEDDPHHMLHDGKTATSRVLVPASTVKKTVVVQRLDTLTKIAARYRTTVHHLLVLNPQIADANLIRVGQKVRVA